MRAFPIRTRGPLLAGAAFLVAACSDRATGPGPGDAEITYAIATVTGAWPDQTTYLQGLPDLPTGTLGTANAIELASSGSMWSYGGALYVYTFGAPATMTRYIVDASGELVADGVMVTPGANTYSTLQFRSPTEAYASVAGGLAKVVRFNPTTMQTLGEIDLSSLARPDANSIWYIGSYVRDDKLFLAVDYQQNFAAAFDSAFVAVIDLATQQLDTLIADGRTAMIFAAGLGVNAFVEDANGDIYVQARGNRDSGGNRGSGVLRIRSGELTFDPTYFFDLEHVLGNPAYGLWHFPQEGVTFTFRAEDPANMWDFSGPNYRLHRIDLVAGTSLGAVADLPLTKGSSTQFMRRFSAGTIHFAIAGASEDAIYAYHTASGTATRRFLSAGGQFSGFEKIR